MCRLLPGVHCIGSYLIEVFVVEATVYPVDAHVSEEQEGQHAEEDTCPACRNRDIRGDTVSARRLQGPGRG